MKNKKRLLIGTLPVLLLGLVGASLGTVAWFEATRNIVAGDSDKSLDVEPSAVTLGDIKLYLDPPSSTLPAVELSDSEGNRWAVIKGADNKYYYQSVPSTSYEGTYGTISLTARAMKMVNGSETPASAGDLKSFEGSEVTFDVYGNDRTRVSLTSPSASNITVYSNAPGSETILNITLKIESVNTTTGTVTYSYNTQSNVSVYYSVSGGTTTPEEGVECPSGEVDTATSGVGHVYIGTYKVPIEPTKRFGMYPQSRVTDAIVLDALANIQTENASGYLEYNDKQYKKLKASPFGSYNFDNGDPIVKNTIYYFEVEPIEWSAFDNGNNTVFMFTKYLLDAQMYHSEWGDYGNPGNNYANSDIRNWLNNDFYNKAFSIDEKQHINETNVDNSEYSTCDDYNPYTCDNTLDYIFLLSRRELCNTAYGFDDDLSSDGPANTRCCKATEYARARGADVSTSQKYLNNGYYWTRSPCCEYCDDDDEFPVWEGACDGSVYSYDLNVREYIGVRPALVLSL